MTTESDIERLTTQLPALPTTQMTTTMTTRYEIDLEEESTTENLTTLLQTHERLQNVTSGTIYEDAGSGDNSIDDVSTVEVTFEEFTESAIKCKLLSTTSCWV